MNSLESHVLKVAEVARRVVARLAHQKATVVLASWARWSDARVQLAERGTPPRAYSYLHHA